MRRVIHSLAAGLMMVMATAAWATFHTFQIQQIFSNADGTVQFLVLHESVGFSGQEFLTGHTLTSLPNGGMGQQFMFPSNLPSSNTAGAFVLIATQGFAALNLVKPDYVVPNNFIPRGSGTINYAQVDQVSYNALPTDGVSAIDRNGMSIPNVATNFAGQSASVSAAAPSVNYEGLWWAAPAGSESGWGINFAHQGDTIFASWFTYDLTGKGLWLVMTAPKTAPNTYSGMLFTTTGPAFNALPFNPAQVVPTQVGTATLSFTDPNTGSFSYNFPAGGVLGNMSPIAQVKAITRQVFGPLPVCATATGSLAAATNYQDLWWAAPAGSESGWGINLTHQGDTIFASWFTYDVNGTPMWLVVTAPKTSPGVYTGMLFRTTGPALNALPFTPANVVATQVGTATFTFSDGNNATFAYTVNGIVQNKAITREVFTNPGTVCQ
jgi:hypothetical protein